MVLIVHVDFISRICTSPANADTEFSIWARGMHRDVITADTNSTCSLPNHIIAMVGGNRLIAGKLDYSSPSSVVINSVSQLRRLMISKGIRLRHWNCWPRGKFRTCVITALLSACNANHVALLPVSGLSLVLHVLLDQTTLLLQKKSTFWLAVWFTLNTSIWCIEIISLITLLSSLLLYKGPQGIGDCFRRRGLVFIVFNTFICTVPLEIKFPQPSPIPLHFGNILL